MKVLDLLSLGTNLASSNKKRTILSVATIGILFGLLFFVNFLYQGFEDLLLTTSMTYAGEKAYLSFGQCNPYIDECETPDSTRERAQAYAEKYHASTEGETEFYKVYKSDEELAAEREAIERISADGGAIELYDFNIKTVYPDSIIDLLPDFGPEPDTTATQQRTPSFVSLPGEFSLLELVFSSVNKDLYSNNLKLEKIAQQKATEEELEDDNTDEPQAHEELIYVQPILVFTNSRDAVNFYNDNSSSKNEIFDVIGNITSIASVFNYIENFLGKVKIALVIVSLIITSFTLIRLVNENAKNIALYRSLGARGVDVFIIYLSYILEICLYTTIFAAGLGAAASVVYSACYNSKIAEVLFEVYALDIKPGILFGLNIESAVLVLMIFASGLTSAILTLDQLSMKNIVKKLKA